MDPNRECTEHRQAFAEDDLKFPHKHSHLGSGGREGGTPGTTHYQPNLPLTERNCQLQALIKWVFTTSKPTFNLNLIKGWCKSPHWRPHLPPACEFMPQSPSSLRISLLCLPGWLFNSSSTPIQTHMCPGPTGQASFQGPGHWSGPQFFFFFFFFCY